MTDEINLKAFCNGMARSPVCREPWSAGEFSYATNAKICIRVARRPDVLSVADRPTEMIDKWLAPGVVDPMPLDRQPVALPAVTLPKPVTTRCAECDGRATKHDCPDCGCECQACAGMGMGVQRIVVRFGDVAIELLQFRLMAGLPNVRCSRRLTSIGHVYFEFDGGRGVAMNVRKLEPDDAVVDADQPAQATGAAT